MLAVIRQTEDGYTARYERRLNHSAEKVWAMLTVNEKLAKWFPELRADDLREGGVMKFDMQDGTYETMEILAFKPQEVLEYTWGEDRVRFELYPDGEGCRLVLIETIRKLTDHTPKDLAGWHVCLDVVEALLDGRTFDTSEDGWKIRHRQYAERIESLFRAD